jgi:glutathione synthase/RimK-type ligase-like ATP-grasp enzyme
MKDRLIEADLKVPPENNPHAMIRNHAKGSYFKWVRVNSLNSDLKRAVRDAVQLIGLDFAAVDCSTIQTPQGIKSTIFEVNSAPGLIDRKVDLFVNKLHELYLD